MIPKLGELANTFEKNTQQMYQAAALEAIREEYSSYFEVLDQHPRLLVGRQVPAIGKEGNETLRDASDAKEWQEAVKSVLVQEINSRAQKATEENAEFLQTIHASIELFQNNKDLIPGTNTFDVELANRFSAMVKPYELRVEGKLQGYTISVQPLIEQLRTQLVSERESAPKGVGDLIAPPTSPPAAGSTPATDPPQEGIPSKAGASADDESDFSALFGTLGLHNLRI